MNSSRVVMGEESVIKHINPRLIKYLSVLILKLKTELPSSTSLSGLFHSFIILCERHYLLSILAWDYRKTSDRSPRLLLEQLT